jgi:hypothetical protein
MPEVVLAESAAAELNGLTRSNRLRALRLMRDIQRHPEKLKPVSVHSALLDTDIFMVRKAGLRLLFERMNGRAIVLAIQSRN